MPLVTCPDCGHQVSDTARSCPSCGRPGPFASVDTPQSATDGAAERPAWNIKAAVSPVISVLGFLIIWGGTAAGIADSRDDPDVVYRLLIAGYGALAAVGVAAGVFGILGLREIRRTGQRGRWVAIFGTVLAVLTFYLGVNSIWLTMSRPPL